MKNKKAMTLAEVLITLAVIGVLVMILVPVISKTTANKEKFLYKKAINTMQGAVSAVMADNGVVNASNFWPELSDAGTSFKQAIKQKIARIGDGSNLPATYTASLSNPVDFISSDGMVWYGIPNEWPTGDDGQPADHITVYVDLNGVGGTNLTSDEAVALGGEEGSNIRKPDRLKVFIKRDGRVMVPTYADLDEGGYNGTNWSYETEYMTSNKRND